MQCRLLPIASLVLAALPVFSRADVAPAAQPSNATADMRRQLDELRVQVDQMRAQEAALEQKLQTQTPPPAAPSQQAIDSAILQDAGQRSQLFSIGQIGTGYDPNRGFVIASDDGNFLIHPFLLLQVRDVSNFREDEKVGSTESENGFEIRRMQIGFDGNVISPDWTYRIFIQTDRSGGDASLFDAWLKYHIPDTAWSIEAGQFKSPFAHEQLVFDRTLLAADRTLVDDILADGEAFSDGIMAIYQQDKWRGRADFSNGYGTNDDNFEDAPSRPTNFGIGLRGEFKAMGDWGAYDQFTSYGNKHDLLVFGGGFDWTEADPADFLRSSLDVQYNHGPLGLYGAYIGKYSGRNGTTAARYSFDTGLVAQISYLVCPKWEVFGRYDYLQLDSDEFTVKTRSTVHELTVGVNYYIYGQNLKVTFDGSYLPNGSPIDDNGSGVLVDNGHGEGVIRAQVQLAL